MIINTDINILGGLPDWKLIYVFLNEDLKTIRAAGGTRSVTTIKTDRSVMRFEKAITNTLLKFINENIESLFRSIIMAEEISADSLLFIFWNASSNNELLHYMNEKVFFPALYSGRVSVKRDEASACIRELKQTESDLKKWSEVTVNTTASKYLTLLKKFGLMEGSLNKTINHLNVNDKMFVLFIYWLVSVSEVSNILNSPWIQYGFCEKQIFIQRIMQKKFSKFFNILYTGDKLSVEPLISYKDIYSHAS
ncbi:MAG TPA: hypothetical protein DF637_07680 [Rikenellaceae bacterium]|nr:hypothetical protein [Rikenellaceae bacterium]